MKKRVYVAILMVLVMLVFTGCDDSTTAAKRKAIEYRQIAAAVNNQHEDLVDAVSLRTSADLAACSMERHRKYQLWLCLAPVEPKDDWVAKGHYEIPVSSKLLYNHSACRDWTASEVVVDICKSEELTNVYKAFDSGQLKVIGSILEWDRVGELSRDVDTFWLVDGDGDGAWDNAAGSADTTGDVFFHAAKEEPDFDGVDKVDLSDDWSGTSKDIEKMFRKRWR